MGHRTAMPSNDQFLARFHSVQQLAQMRLRVNQVNDYHDHSRYDQKTGYI